MRRSVLADSSDLGIYGEALGSDIHPGCFMCTAHVPSEGTDSDPLCPAEHFHGNRYSEQTVSRKYVKLKKHKKEKNPHINVFISTN